MASNDSGVDTSNDSSCTNDNSNSNSNHTSINYVLVPPSDNATNAEVLDGLRQVAQKLSVLQATMPESTSTYKIPSTHLHINKMSRVSSSAKSSRYQHNHSNRNALIPYVCTVPNERKLRLAASVSNVELLVRLLDSGVDPNTSDEHQRSPLHLAASRGSLTNATNSFYIYNRILNYCISGYKDVVKVLLSRGANPNRQDSLGNTPLHLAVCSASSYNFNMVRSSYNFFSLSIVYLINEHEMKLFAVAGCSYSPTKWRTC